MQSTAAQKLAQEGRKEITKALHHKSGPILIFITNIGPLCYFSKRIIYL